MQKLFSLRRQKVFRKGLLTDLTHLGHPPVRIETAAGRAEYARAQAGFARRAAPLRDRLIDLCDTLLPR